ncbi:MAG: tRNA pseudouridine(38-40) synthase TruA [Akkermansia sp.]|nr:tRNA pseudouridine(38-40) synthase TruA [Akkermansia sp.]
MPRILFTCAYDGTPWHGWQSQAGGETLQDVIEGAFCAILRNPLRIAASGRTDAGVHALAQCFHADIPESCRMTPENWRAALNAHLPASIRILQARVVAGDFHARFDAKGKIYEYLVCTAPVLSPFMFGRAWHRPMGVDVAALRAALAVYEGEHDFRRFAARRGNEPDAPPEDFYVRTIYRTSVIAEEGSDMLRLRFHGNGFMYRMVRMLVGTAHQVSIGKMTERQLASMLTELHAPKTRFCAPPEGLYLQQVIYD